jgi:hypothetical protein
MGYRASVYGKLVQLRGLDVVGRNAITTAVISFVSKGWDRALRVRSGFSTQRCLGNVVRCRAHTIYCVGWA